MNLAQLSTFLAVTRYRSFSKAARELRLTQSGISRQISRLEKELGSVLIKRSSKSVELTFVGEQFRLYAENLLAQHRQFLGKLKEPPAAMASTLRIAASMAAGEFFVPRMIDRFVAMHPGLKPEVFITDSAQVLEELRAGRWDLGFVRKQIQTRGLQYSIVAEDEIVLAVPRSHPFATREKIKLAELEGQPFIEPDLFTGTLKSVRSLLAERGLSLLQYPVVTYINSTLAILSAVERGIGIGWVSTLALGPEWRERVSAVRLEELTLQRHIYMAQIKNRPLSPVAKAFAAWVRKKGKALAQAHEPGGD